MTGKYPDVKEVLRRFDITPEDDVLMSCDSNGVIGFKERCFVTYQASVRSASNPKTVAGKLAGGENKLAGAGVHEFGHLVELALIQKSNAYKDDKEREAAWKRQDIAEKIVTDAYELARNTPEGRGKSLATLIRQISSRAMDNRSECLSESVTAYQYLGIQAPILARIIYDIVEGGLTV